MLIFNNVFYDPDEEKVYCRTIKGDLFVQKFVDYGFKKTNVPTEYTEFLGGGYLIKSQLKTHDPREKDAWDYYYDLSPERKFLLEHAVNFLSENKNTLQVRTYDATNIAYIDIEVEESGGFASIKEFKSNITAISIIVENKRATEKENRLTISCFFLTGELPIEEIDEQKKIFKALCLSELEKSNITATLFIVPSISEEDLLRKFCEFIEITSPEFVSGWNSEEFDLPYIITRIKKLFNTDATLWLKKLSPFKKITRRNKNDIPGLSSLDLMKLYKKYYSSNEKSYSLNSVSKKILNRHKAIQEGVSLSELRSKNLSSFLYYNFYDVFLVYLLEQKLRLIETAVELCAETNTLYRDVFYSSVIIDNAIIARLLREKKIPPPTKRKEKNDDEELKFEGAFVKEPQKGLFEWVFDLDVESLYPNIIIGLNISPETRMMFLGEKEISFEKKQQLFSSGYSLSKHNVVYSKHTVGVLPSLVLDWIEKRKRYKRLMKEDPENYSFYNKKQQIQKILVNSVYGVMGLPTYRFYCVDDCLSVTITGQHIVQKGMTYGNEYLNTIVMNKNKDKDIPEVDYCLYSDTDSLFFKVDSSLFPEDATEQEKKEIVFDVSAKTMEYVNQKVNEFFSRECNFELGRIYFKREYIARSSIFLEKKHYAQWLIDNEGLSIDKIDLKGIEAIRSNYPEVFSSTMQEFIRLVLRQAPLKEIASFVKIFSNKIRREDPEQLLIQTGAGDIDKYSVPFDTISSIKESYIKGTPIHIKAAIAYNYIAYKSQKTLKDFIRSSDKIKYAYVKTPNKYGIECLAIPTTTADPEIKSFLLNNIDVEKMKHIFFDSKIEKILAILCISETDLLNAQTQLF